MASKILVGAGVAGIVVIGAFVLQYSLGAEAREEKALWAKSHELSDFLERAHHQPSLDQACADLDAIENRLRDIAIQTNQSYIRSAALRFCQQPPAAQSETHQ